MLTVATAWYQVAYTERSNVRVPFGAYKLVVSYVVRGLVINWSDEEEGSPRPVGIELSLLVLVLVKKRTRVGKSGQDKGNEKAENVNSKGK
jgi:hypothetical protein